ncbi:MAG: 4a-hydroxytetrahydrobiopterin dehydratase [Oceanospirillaceae bacterium]
MEVLTNLNCTNHKTENQLISPFIIRPLMAQLPDWELVVDNDKEHLKAEFKIKNYMKAIAFCNAIAELAEAADHHPKIIIEYAKVTVYWWTHTLRGLHKNDFILAAKTSALLK